MVNHVPCVRSERVLAWWSDMPMSLNAETASACSSRMTSGESSSRAQTAATASSLGEPSM
eukprot:2611077-Lingulodinium_polyedra.AAC.1